MENGGITACFIVIIFDVEDQNLKVVAAKSKNGRWITLDHNYDMLRKIVEKASRGVVFKRRISGEFGRRKIHVSPEAALSYWGFGDYDPMLTRIVSEQIGPNDIAWDLGANVGLFSISSASMGASVHAFEPDTFMISLLRSSILQNSDLDVMLYPVAIAHKEGFLKLNIANRGRATNFLEIASGSSQTGGVRDAYLVPCFSGDWLLENTDIQPPTFIKIDVEGAEEHVLEGMSDLLNQHKPSILCEVRDSNRDTISSRLLEIGYQLYDANDMKSVTNDTLNIIAFNETG